MSKNFDPPFRRKGDLCKVVFDLGDDPWHGYATERVWAEVVSEDRFRIMNSPFFAKGISFLDVVFARPLEAVYEFAGISMRAGHSTYRVIPSPGTSDTDFDRRWEELANLGCTYESGDFGFKLFSIDVPPSTNVYEVYNLLERGEADGIWDFEEGHCGHLLSKDSD